MKKAILLFIILSLFFIIGVPKYVELNNLAIIEGLGLEYNEQSYALILKEIIPIKSDAGMTYKYNYYVTKGTNIKSVFEKIKYITDKKIYLHRLKFIITNLASSKDICVKLDYCPKKIYHCSENIEKKIRAINS